MYYMFLYVYIYYIYVYICVYMFIYIMSIYVYICIMSIYHIDPTSLGKSSYGVPLVHGEEVRMCLEAVSALPQT
jgi:hypothetical protein